MSVDEYAVVAQLLVNDIIDASLQNLQKELFDNQGEFSRSQIVLSEHLLGSRLGYIEDNSHLIRINCPIQDFTIDHAETKLHQFIKTWRYQKGWLYCIDYLGCEQFDYDVRFRFRVKWSIPTRRTPIPRATASIYFTFSVSKVKPRSHPVDIYYVFETNRLVHKPGESKFREQWLKDIIENKMIVMESVCF